MVSRVFVKAESYTGPRIGLYCDLWHAHCWWCHLQTGSGKTYTMGTGYTVGGSLDGVIPQVMQTIFKRIETLKHKADFQLRVSFIEVCHLLIYPSLWCKCRIREVLFSISGSQLVELYSTNFLMIASMIIFAWSWWRMIPTLNEILWKFRPIKILYWRINFDWNTCTVFYLLQSLYSYLSNCEP